MFLSTVRLLQEVKKHIPPEDPFLYSLVQSHKHSEKESKKNSDLAEMKQPNKT